MSIYASRLNLSMKREMIMPRRYPEQGPAALPNPFKREEGSRIVPKPAVMEDEISEEDLEEGGFEPAYETYEEALDRRERVLYESMMAERIEQYVEAALRDRLAQSRADTISGTYNALRNGKIITTTDIQSGSNGAKRLLLRLEKAKTMVAFQKGQHQEYVRIVIDGVMYDVINTIVESEGEMIIKTQYHETKFLPGQDKKQLHARYARDVKDQKFVYDKQEELYNIPQRSIEYSDEVGLRFVPTGKTVYHEMGVSVIAELAGLQVYPLTTLTTDGEMLYSRQKGIERMHPLSIKGEAYNTYLESIVKNTNHPAHASLIKCACLHYLVKYTDGHKGNVMVKIDEDPKSPYYGQIIEFNVIDGGYAWSREESTGKGRQISDELYSIPMDLVAEYPGLILDRAIRNELQALYTELQDTQSASYHAVMKMLELMYGINGDPESTFAIADKEFTFFLERMKHVIETGRPGLIGDGLKREECRHDKETATRLIAIKAKVGPVKPKTIAPPAMPATRRADNG